MSCQSLVVSLGENPPLLELAKKQKAAVLIHGLGNNGYDSFGVGYAAAEFLECPFGISLGDALPDSASLEQGILRLTETKSDMVVGQRCLDEQAKAHPGGLPGVIFGNALQERTLQRARFESVGDDILTREPEVDMTH